MVTVSALSFYPVKGCAAVSASVVELTSAGPLHDRSFMVVTPDGALRSQRCTPRLAVIRPEITVSGDRLTLWAPGVTSCVVDVDLDRARCDVLLFATSYRAIDQGDAVADWLTALLGSPSRLVRVPPEHHRVTAGLTPGTAGFADGAAVHFTTRSSLAALNRRVVEGGGEPVRMDRFRPNLVLDGWPEPHQEDRVRTLTVGGAELAFAALDIRCAVTLVDQRSGDRAGPEPLRTLARYRRVAAGGVSFGVKASVVRPGRIRVGDQVLVSRWDTAER